MANRPTKPSNPHHPHLRLRRDEPSQPDSGQWGGAPESYKFPGTSAGMSSRTTRSAIAGRVPRERLVAARVDRSPVERKFTGSSSPCAVVNGPDELEGERECAGRIISSRDLVREIESTLDRMQARLSRFRDQMDDAFKFPAADQDFDPPHRPRAA